MILAENQVGRVTKENNIYTISIKDKDCQLDQNKWGDLISRDEISLRYRITGLCPYIAKVIGHNNKAMWGKLYELVRQAANSEDRLKTQ